jgi:hypothetical protein
MAIESLARSLANAKGQYIRYASAIYVLCKLIT